MVETSWPSPDRNDRAGEGVGRDRYLKGHDAEAPPEASAVQAGSRPGPAAGEAVLPRALPPGRPAVHLPGPSRERIPEPSPLGKRRAFCVWPGTSGTGLGRPARNVPQIDGADSRGDLPGSGLVPQRRFSGQHRSLFLHRSSLPRGVLPRALPRGGLCPACGGHHRAAPGGGNLASLGASIPEQYGSLDGSVDGLSIQPAHLCPDAVGNLEQAQLGAKEACRV